MLKYEEVLTHIVPGALISFRAYKLDNHEHRKLTFALQNVIVYKAIPANQTLTRLEMEDIFSDTLSIDEYLQLATQNCFRMVIVTAKGTYLKYTVIAFQKDFYENGLQEIVFPNLDLDTKFVRKIKRTPINV